MFIKLFDFILTPSCLITTLFIFGVAFSAIRRTRKFGFALAGMGITLYFFMGNGPLAYYLMGKLEHRHPPLKQLKPEADVKLIVVLAGYGVSDDYFPQSSMVNDASLFRTVEAARFWYEAPSATILLAGSEHVTVAMATLLQSLHIPDTAVQRMPSTQSTMENIQSIAPFVDEKSFLLVTSAGHMPRAVLICHLVGLKPTPAPTDFYTSPQPLNADWFPSPFYLKCSDLAIHEFLAIFYLKIKHITVPAQ